MLKMTHFQFCSKAKKKKLRNTKTKNRERTCVRERKGKQRKNEERIAEKKKEKRKKGKNKEEREGEGEGDRPSVKVKREKGGTVGKKTFGFGERRERRKRLGLTAIIFLSKHSTLNTGSVFYNHRFMPRGRV